MVALKAISVGVLLCAVPSAIAAQTRQNEVSLQSPRQAVVEMLNRSDDAFRKHLTVEIQHKIDEMQKSAPGSSPTQALSAARNGGNNFEAFETGPVLFSFNNPQTRQRWELRIDGDDVRGEQDEMQLSLHSVTQGVDDDLPALFRFQLSLRQQLGIWRLNAVTVSARLEMGDPRILDKSWWSAALASNASPDRPTAASIVPGVGEKPKIPIARSLRLIGLAEGLYAQKHPGMGYTCALTELVDIGRGIEDGESYKFIPAELAQGVYNEYKFSLRGCSGKTVKSFQAVAEPVNGKGKAYCSDETRVLRASDDASGTTCLTAGKIVQR